MMKFSRKLKIFFICISLLLISTNIYPIDQNQRNNVTNRLILSHQNIINSSVQAASDGQYIDHVLLFLAPTTNYTFNFTFVKNEHYSFSLQLYIPNAQFDVSAKLVGPDADGDGSPDVFYLAQGVLKTNSNSGSDSGSFQFGCAMTGNYTLYLNGSSTENVNVYFHVQDKGPCFSGSAIVYDTNAYYNGKIRQYYFQLKDDVEYEISAQRVNSITWNDSSTAVTINIVDYLGHIYNIMNNASIGSVFSTSNTDEKFGISINGTYYADITVTTTIPTINLLVILQKVNNIGDGPEGNPITNENSTLPNNSTSSNSNSTTNSGSTGNDSSSNSNSTTNSTANSGDNLNSTTNLKISIPSYVLPITLGAFITILVLAIIGIKRKKKTPRIVAD